MQSNAKEKMFYCVYIGNWKVSNTARDVHWSVKQASRVQEIDRRTIFIGYSQLLSISG